MATSDARARSHHGMVAGAGFGLPTAASAEMTRCFHPPCAHPVAQGGGWRVEGVHHFLECDSF